MEDFKSIIIPLSIFVKLKDFRMSLFMQGREGTFCGLV